MTESMTATRYRSILYSTQWLILVIAGLASCATQTPNAPNPLVIDSGEYTRIYTAAVQVLRGHGFRIDHHSHRLGKITTHYQPAPTIFEPWLTQSTTPEQAWASSLNEQRCTVSILLEPSSPDRNDQSAPPQKASSSYQMRVHAMVERQQSPRRFLTGSTAGHSVFGSLSSTPAELRERGITGTYWQPLGRDIHLEQLLISEIVRKSLEIQSSDITLNTNSD